MINCRGQSYDGASNMSGIYNGVSSIILNQHSKAIYVHCVAHCLDLAVHDLTDQCASVGYCLLYVKDIIDFIRRSPKRRAILKNIVNQISLSYANLTALCPTRWTMRASSYDSLLKRYEQGDNDFELLYDQVIKESDGLTEQSVLPRPRRPPQRYDININSNRLLTCFVIDSHKEILNSCEVENFILSICNKPPDGSNDHIGAIIEFCRHDINVEK
ncbi:unnamed protein product [Rotaria magnacalcarata]|uniref:Uncharacterized protein n=1 Tax=Rotaria magnacalcarata TaxID=392030 RepID=A0A820KKG1_9BILA|nr:unnamed protein product [Rotaria magnacalcarata]